MWKTNLDVFDLVLDWWRHSGGVKTSKFWDSAFKNENLTLIFPLLLTSISLSPLVHEIQVWVILDPILG